MSLRVANVDEHLKSRSTPTPSSSTIEPSVSKGGVPLVLFAKTVPGAPFGQGTCTSGQLHPSEALIC